MDDSRLQEVAQTTVEYAVIVAIVSLGMCLALVAFGTGLYADIIAYVQAQTGL